MPNLLLTIRFHDGRYHGIGDWPPSPARLFQALVAGAARGSKIDDEDKRALKWLEAQDAPTIAAPPSREVRGFTNYVPNNDLDAVGGDPRRVGEIRAPKIIKARLFDVRIPLLYAWPFREGEEAYAQAEQLCIVAERIYQLGRGVDMAWVVGEVLDGADLGVRLAEHPGVLHQPSENGNGRPFSCPVKGSLESLVERHLKSCERFRTTFEPAPTKKQPSKMKPAGQTFSQPPKARFDQVSYDSPPTHLVFDIRKTEGETSTAGFAPQPLAKVARFVERVRNLAAKKLENALNDPKVKALVEPVFIGVNASEADKAARIHIIALPSIGHAHADHAIRRILVKIPPNCPLRADDIGWTFSGLEISDPETGEISGTVVRAEDRGMLDRYGVDEASRLWRTVTPAALPVMRRRGKACGSARAENEGDAAHAALQALRHAGIAAKAEVHCVQREPFEAKGARAEHFAAGTRFSRAQMWHLEIAFTEPVRGPLVIGDGRYLGLGLMAPAPGPRAEGVLAFTIKEGALGAADPILLARALRRAVMARVQAALGEGKPLPTFFSGHEPDGAPARSGDHEHLGFVYDAARRRLLLVAPHVLERRAPREREDEHLKRLDEAMRGLCELRRRARPLTTGRSHSMRKQTRSSPQRRSGRAKRPIAC